MQTIYLALLSVLLNNIPDNSSKDDKVESLPDYSYKGETYSGFLKAGPNKQFHYLLNLAQENPEIKPLVLSLQGGPGCSSLETWAVMTGPMKMDKNGKFQENQYSWNKEANMLYIESPGEVGFSFVNSESKEDFEVNDDITAKDNLNAILSFFLKFPEFKGRDFYLSGESYSGIYIPMLAYEIINYNKIVPESNKINVKGIIVGNGVVDWRYDVDKAILDYTFSHNFASYEMRLDYNKYCIIDLDTNKCNETIIKTMSMINNMNLYDYSQIYDIPGKYDEGVTDYLNREDVKDALHVNNSKRWDICSAEIDKRYVIQKEKGSIWVFPTLIENNIRILMYSGDTDMCVPFNGNQKWIENLNLEIEKPWRQWRAFGEPNFVSGYVENYKGLTFCTIRGTGHLATKWKPKETFYMFSKFLKNEEF